MKVIVAEHAGFCWGVTRVVRMTEELAAASRRPLYTYGPLIHNQAVIERLEAMGVRTLRSMEGLQEVERDAVVVIRAHGVPPDEYERLRGVGVEVVDGTCPHVHTIQQKVAAAYARGRQVVILGDEGHAEVAGLLGFCLGRGVVIGTLEQAARIDVHVPLTVVAQSTLDGQAFEVLTEAIKTRARDVEIEDTRCNATARTQAAAVRLCGLVEVMVVVGGRNSANTNRLVQLCAAQGVPSVHVERAAELRKDDMSGKAIAGVTAGSSTPDWIIVEVVELLRTW